MTKMSISKLFENIRKAQARNKVLAYLLNWVLSLIMLGGFWILIQYGADDDRYFWLGIMMAIIAGLQCSPQYYRMSSAYVFLTVNESTRANR